MRCQSFTARLALGQTEDLALDVARQWLTPSSLPECEPAFTWLRNEQALTPELIEQRVRRALEANNASFAKQIAVQLPPERSAPLLRWAALIETPAEADRCADCLARRWKSNPKRSWRAGRGWRGSIATAPCVAMKVSCAHAG